MVLGKFVNGLSYPETLYYSGQAYGFTYFPLLVDPPGAWDDVNNRWLASLFGLSYERVMADGGDYIDKIWKYLQQGLPVLACRGWFGVSEAGAEIRVGGKRAFWWEGMSKEARTQIHYLTIVGMDRANGTLYVNDPIYCWHGIQGKYAAISIDRFRRSAGQTPPMHKYIIKVFKETGEPRKREAEIQELVNHRIVQKLRGKPSVYDTPDTWRCYFGMSRNPRVEYGLKGLKSFRDDLEPFRFKSILEFLGKQRGMRPVDRLSYLNLYVYHRSMLTSIAAEYLEANNRIEEWKWLFELHMLYERLWLSTTKLCSIFRSSQSLGQAVDTSKPVLGKMRGTIDQMIDHIESYIESRS